MIANNESQRYYTKVTTRRLVYGKVKGSHKIYKHPDKPQARIILPDHGMNKEPSIGGLNDIKKKAGWK